MPTETRIKPMPTAAEADQANEALQRGHDRIEALVWRVERAADSDNGSDLPFTVGMAEIGVVATLAADVENHARMLNEFVGRLESSIFCLNAIRVEQAAAAQEAGGDG